MSRDCVVLVITQHNLPEPCTDFGHAIMHSALKLNLDGFEFRNHSLFRSDPPSGEGSALVALPTVVGKQGRTADCVLNRGIGITPVRSIVVNAAREKLRTGARQGMNVFHLAD